MATASVTVRMDSDLKEKFNYLCGEIGLSMAAAMTVFAKQAVREHRIPFEIGACIPNKDTIEAMLEAEKIARDPNAKRYNNFREALEDIMSDDEI